jgi:hypothetical protein
MKFLVQAVLAVSPLVLFTTVAKADTIFDVEHARANYRAGLTSEYDAELLRRWGRPSGYYPQYEPPPPRRIDLRRPWRERR